MTDDADLTALLTALADPRRREIVDLLAGGERAVGELVEALALPQPLVSKQLKALKDAGLVEARAVGQHRLYHLRPEGLRAVADWAAAYARAWEARLDRMESYLNTLDDEGAPG